MFLLVSYVFSFFIFIFCTSDFRHKLRVNIIEIQDTHKNPSSIYGVKFTADTADNRPSKVWKRVGVGWTKFNNCNYPIMTIKYTKHSELFSTFRWVHARQARCRSGVQTTGDVPSARTFHRAVMYNGSVFAFFGNRCKKLTRTWSFQAPWKERFGTTSSPVFWNDWIM